MSAVCVSASIFWVWGVKSMGDPRLCAGVHPAEHSAGIVQSNFGSILCWVGCHPILGVKKHTFGHQKLPKCLHPGALMACFRGVLPIRSCSPTTPARTTKLGHRPWATGQEQGRETVAGMGSLWQQVDGWHHSEGRNVWRPLLHLERVSCLCTGSAC